MRVKIYIENTYDPLTGSLGTLIRKAKYSVTKDANNADIIISFAYHDKNDIVKMNTMRKMMVQYPGKKIIFLSWFHTLHDYNRYSNLFSPEKFTCALMDTNIYRILQLPVSIEEMVNTISFFSLQPKPL